MQVCTLLWDVVTQEATRILLVKPGSDHSLAFEARDEAAGLPREAIELFASR